MESPSNVASRASEETAAAAKAPRPLKDIGSGADGASSASSDTDTPFTPDSEHAGNVVAIASDTARDGDEPAPPEPKSTIEDALDAKLEPSDNVANDEDGDDNDDDDDDDDDEWFIPKGLPGRPTGTAPAGPPRPVKR